MLRVLGFLYLSGGLLVFLSLLLPHPQDVVRAGLWVIVGVGLGVGSASMIWSDHARVWMPHALLAFGTVCICLCQYFADVASGVYSSMFVWVVLSAASFFSARAVAAHVAWVLMTWGATFAVVAEASGFSAVTRWALSGFVLVVAAVAIHHIVAGRRLTEEKLRNEIGEKEDLQRQLEHLAHHDPLTGLANRRRFEAELGREIARATRQKTALCLVALDLDGLKAYNDANGHSAGDRLLKLAANAWTRSLRAGDLLARIGGDEFVVLLPDCTPKQARRVVKRLSDRVPLGQTCSTGTACWNGEESSCELMRRADLKMYESKRHVAVRRLVSRQAS